MAEEESIPVVIYNVCGSVHTYETLDVELKATDTCGKVRSVLKGLYPDFGKHQYIYHLGEETTASQTLGSLEKDDSGRVVLQLMWASTDSHAFRVPESTRHAIEMKRTTPVTDPKIGYAPATEASKKKTPYDSYGSK